MATHSNHQFRGARRRATLVVAVAGLAATAGFPAGDPGHITQGAAARPALTGRPTIEVAFEREKSRPLSTTRPLTTTSSRAYGWPVRPFDRQHPVRGAFGDPRIGGVHKTTRQFHFGVDVSAPNGTPVYATIDGTVSLLNEGAISVKAGNGVAFEYWHIVPAVRPGARVEAYRTVIGHVERPWAHVHFSEYRNGRYVNPLRPGGMGPYLDDTRPVVRAVHLRNGQLTADVEDVTPLAVPEPWASLPVMPAVVRWRLAGGRWQTALDVRSTIPAASFFGTVYASATRQNHAWTPGLYRVRLGRAVPGAVVEVTVADSAGNTSSVSVRVR